ncbi:LOW QUALITY PROTEIN: WAT1-related protein [Populus alba x Populus x berolinensis]|nr:LOW QUALITY PROTEIN: WAT1-related protein [Populus alba x Populus x berolinensis]
MDAFEDSKPALAMLGMQFSYAIVSLITRAALIQGMNPRVFVVYRQAIATVFIAPLAHFSRKSGGTSMGLRSFSLVFSASLIGVTINQNVFAEGLYLASSSMASAMGNLVPAITFVMAFLIGPEKINIRSFRSVAKIVGTVICVSGAISMALLRGPKLLNTTIFESGGEDWLLGCLLIFASTFCWSIWLILQVPVTASYPDHLSLSAWLCFLATLQSGILTLFLEKDLDAWKLHSYLEVAGCLFTGIIGSGISFFVQAWVISQRGPLFSAMFNPLSTVIVTVLAAIFLHEEIYTGSLIGAVSVIIGLYIVLWGKAKDFIKEEDEVDPKLEIDERQTVKITIEESRGVEPFLEEPLLSDKSNDIEESKRFIILGISLSPSADTWFNNSLVHVRALHAREMRMEKTNIRSLRSIGKIVGHVSVGEMSMALLKGPKLLNTELLPIKSSSTGSGSKTWLLGSIILFGNSCSIVIWKIVQNRFQYQLGVLIPYSLLFGCVSSDPYNNSNYDLHKTRSTSMETAFNS